MKKSTAQGMGLSFLGLVEFTDLGNACCSVYGSGYPGVTGSRCDIDCNFPFVFWLAVWEPTPHYPYPRPQYVDSQQVCRAVYSVSANCSNFSVVSTAMLATQVVQEDP